MQEIPLPETYRPKNDLVNALENVLMFTTDSQTETYRPKSNPTDTKCFYYSTLLKLNYSCRLSKTFWAFKYPTDLNNGWVPVCYTNNIFN